VISEYAGIRQPGFLAHSRLQLGHRRTSAVRRSWLASHPAAGLPGRCPWAGPFWPAAMPSRRDGLPGRRSFLGGRRPIVVDNRKRWNRANKMSIHKMIADPDSIQILSISNNH